MKRYMKLTITVTIISLLYVTALMFGQGYPKTLTQAGVFNNQALDAVNALIRRNGIMTTGNVWWVMPRTGRTLSSGADGKSPATAFRNLTDALTMATANQNDVVIFASEGNTASQTTDYQAGLLDWNKDMVHLIGINSGSMFSPRSRIAFTPLYNTATDLFKLSANGCLIANMEIFMGVAGTLPTGAMTVSGMRNHIINSHIAGFGGASHTNDINGAYSLRLYGAEENVFEDDVIGVDTIQLGNVASNSQILFSANASGTGVTRNIFNRCRVVLWTTHATNTNFLRAAAGSMDRFNEFCNTSFINYYQASTVGTLLTQAFVVGAGGSPAGIILLTGSTAVHGATDWNSTDAGNVIAMGYSPTAGTYGLSTVITR